MKLMNKASGELFDRQEERIVLIPFQITIFGGIAMNKRVIRLSFLFFSLVLRQLAYAEDTSNLLSFANSLFDEKDYYRAITEYKRFLHLFPSHPELDSVRYFIGLSYFRGEKWDAAINAFRNIQPGKDSNIGARAQLMMGEASYQSGDYAGALDSFEAFTQNTKSNNLSQHAAMREIQCLFLLGKTQSARVKAVQIANQHPTDDRILTLYRKMMDSDDIPQKSPVIACSLSAVLPGAGQLYTGRYRDAGISFLLNSALITLAVIAFQNDEPVAGGIISGVELSWYLGNIYGAANAAHKFNRSQKQLFIEKLDVSCGIMKDANDSPIPAGSITIHF